MKLAVLGASGFVGSRLVEIFHLNRAFEVRPIVRSYNGLARLARFELDWRLADARDERALNEAFKGCDLVLHSVSGPADVIRDSVAPAYRAAARQNVRRLVFMSSAVVHGQEPASGTTEDTPLITGQDRPYNQAKVDAEKCLQKVRASGATEIVVLRPGIVFGPRAHWIADPAKGLLNGTYAWVNKGRGICNSIYVDNLIEAIRLALTVPGVDREAFLIGDRETVTWADLIGPIAAALGIDIESIPDLPPKGDAKTWRERAESLHASRPAQAVISFLPARWKSSVKAGLREWQRAPAGSPWGLPSEPAPRLSVTREREILFQCAYRLPQAKAERLLGYRPPVSFDEGLRRSIEWLGFVGYPIGQARAS